MSALSFVDFRTMVNAYMYMRKKDVENDRVNAGRVAWLMGSDSGSTFGKFCEKYGLIERVDKPEKVNTQKLYDMAEQVTKSLISTKG